MKRLAAAVVAIAMVLISLAVRANIDDSGTSSSSTSGSRPVVACITELADVCRAAYGSSADVRVEPAATTAAALAKGPTDIDDWVTLDGWPQLVGARSGTTISATPLASTPLVLAVVADRATALAGTCGDTSWHCLLTSAGRPWSELGGRPDWGSVKVAVGPRSSALGLLLRANALSSLASEGVAVATNDDDYASALGAVERADDRDEPLQAYLLAFPATFAAVGTTAAALDAQVGRYRDLVTVVTPSPEAQAIAVVAHVGGSRTVDPRSLVRPLTAAGWQDPPAAASGLPDPGVLLALSGV